MRPLAPSFVPEKTEPPPRNITLTLGATLVFAASALLLAVVNLPQAQATIEREFPLLLRLPVEALMIGVMVGVVLLTVNNGAIPAAIRARLRRGQTGEAVAMADLPVAPGQSFDLRYEQPLARGMDVDEVRVTLLLRERATATTGEGVSVSTEDHQAERYIVPGQRARAGQRLQVTQRLTLPPNAPPTWPTEGYSLPLDEHASAQLAELEAKKRQMPAWAEQSVASLAEQTITGQAALRNRLAWHVVVEVHSGGGRIAAQAWELPVTP